MRKVWALLIIAFLGFELWAGISVPWVSASSLRSATLNLVVGETYEYNYFNLTLVDMNPVSGTVLVNVSGIQGSELVTAEDAFTDVFGDGTIQIRAVAVYVSNKQATVEVRVDVEALANVACSLLESLISEAEANGTLPESVLNQSRQSLTLAQQYRDSGWYDDAIQTAWRALDNLRSTIKIATEARKAIIDAKKAVTDPSTCVSGCKECPLSITVKVKKLISEAEDYYQQGNFEDALQTANSAINMIKDCCNSCKVFPERKKELEDYLAEKEKTIPSELFKAVRDKIDTAQKYYDNGDCVDAISYLDDAKEVAETIVEKWDETMTCRASLLSNITRAGKRYYTIFNSTVIRIKVDDLEKSAREDLYKLITSGYFQTALSKCSKLADDLKAREEKFNETKAVLGDVWEHITGVKAEGYVVNPAVSIFVEGLNLMEQGNYEGAKAKFLEANQTANEIVLKAIEAKKAKNETLSCLTKLKAEGIDTQSVFGEDMSRAEELYKKGDYEGAKLQWESIKEKCNDPELETVIETRNEAHSLYDKTRAEGIKIPGDVDNLIEQADRSFRDGDFTLAKEEYNGVIKKLNELKDIEEDYQKTSEQAEKFYEQSSKWGKTIAKWFGIPVVEERFEKIKELREKIQKDQESGNYTALKKDLAELKGLMNDIDGDNSKNWDDPLPYVPNYYLIGLLFSILMMFFNLVR
ncbi:hypothetical protein [Thermococcus sp.]|uniref:hypothetical protein n=1 Tax=Thermococcus sp. TaxID=35749 RepID=UPI002616A85A|nr:hypothetical protein [Thermococcus sp.]